MSSKKINLLLTNSDGVAESLSFEKTDLLVGSSEIADIKVYGEGIPAVHSRLVLENGSLKVDPVDGGKVFSLKEGDSFSIGDSDEYSLEFESYSSIVILKDKSPSVDEVLDSAEKMASSHSELADVEAEAENYLHSVKVAEARLSKASQDADLQFQSKLSQSSARAHRILEQTTKDIDVLTQEAQKKVHYLNHEIEEKSAQLHKTILFLESQTAQKQEDLESMTSQMEELEYKRVSLKKDLRIKEKEFGALQAEYSNLVNSKKDEILHLSEDANKRRAELEEVNEKLILEEKRFEEKTYILKKNISTIEAEEKEKMNLIAVLKENYRNLEEDLEALNHEKEKAVIKVKEEEGILSVLQKKKDLIKTETQRIIGQSKEEAMSITKSAVLKAEDLKRESIELKETAKKEAAEAINQAKEEALRISRESKENAQKLIDVARVDARQVITSAEAKLKEAQLDYSNKLKTAEAESMRMQKEAEDAKNAMLKEIEEKRKEQIAYIESELRKFKDGLSAKKASHLRLVGEGETLEEDKQKTETVLSDFSDLIRDFTPEATENREDNGKLVEDENLKNEEEEEGELAKDTAKETTAAVANEAIKEEALEEKVVSLVADQNEEQEVKDQEGVAASTSQDVDERVESNFKALVEDNLNELSAEDAHNEIPQAVAKIEEEQVKEENTEFFEAPVSEETEESVAVVAKEKVDHLKPLREAFSKSLGSLKLLFASKHFRLAVPGIAVAALCIVYGPKMMTQIKEKRAASAEVAAKKAEKEKAAKEKQIADAKNQEVAKRSVSSIAKIPAKAVDVYHKSYTDRLLYTENYMKNEFKSSYRSKWITEMRSFVVDKAKLPESQLAPIITTETALLRALDQMNKRSKNTDLMVKLEEQLLNKLKTQFKSEKLYSEFFDMKERFYKKEYPVK